MYAEGARHIGHCLVTLDGPGSLFCLDESRHCLMHCKEGSVFSGKDGGLDAPTYKRRDCNPLAWGQQWISGRKHDDGLRRP